MKKKSSFEDILIPVVVLLSLWLYFKTGSLTMSLVTGFGLLSLYIGILAIKYILRKRKTLRSGIAQIDEMTGREFEYYLSQLIAKQGYKVKMTQTAGDFGADLVLTTDAGKCIVVQAKRYKKNVGIKAVQEVGTSMAHYKASEAWVITNSSYTKAARTLAKSNNVQLFDREDLINWIIKVKEAKVG